MTSSAAAPDLLAGSNSLNAFDVERLRADFPILKQEVHGKPLTYLDNAASLQKPRQVLEAMQQVYETRYANVHRGAHTMSQLATDAFEAGDTYLFVDNLDISNRQARRRTNTAQSGDPELLVRLDLSGYVRPEAAK